MTPDNPVGVAPRLRNERPWKRPIPGRGLIFSPMLQGVHAGSGADRRPMQWVLGDFLRGKEVGA
jgi:hypothetical protein